MTIRSSLRCALAVALLGLLAACASTFRTHGYVPPAADLAGIAVGRDTRDEVAAAVGRPTAAGLLRDDGWYYVESRFRHYAYRAPQEIDREVVAISFDGSGRVSNIERFGLERGRVVPLSRRVTEAPVQGIGFLRQLFGNLGNFDPGSFFEDG